VPAPPSFRRLRTFPSASVTIFSSAVSPPLPRTRDRVALRERTTISTESILNGDRGLRPRSGDELGGVEAFAGVEGGLEAEAGLEVEGGLAAETGLRVGDVVLRGLAAGRRLRATVTGAGEEVDTEAGVPIPGAGGGARTLPALLLSASLSPVRGALRRTRRAGVSVVPAVVVAGRGNVDFRAVCLVRRGPLAVCPIAPTPRAISAMPLSSVNLEALPSSSSSSSLSAKSPGGGRARLTRPVLEPALALGRGSRARML
jgi:hypothetical protein